VVSSQLGEYDTGGVSGGVWRYTVYVKAAELTLNAAEIYQLN